jgi:WD40 repeat protein
MRRRLVLLVVLGCPVTLLAEQPPSGFTPLFNGKDLSGWEFLNCSVKDWLIDDGALSTAAGKPRATNAWLLTEAQYDDFELRLEYLVTKGAKAGLLLRSPSTGLRPYTNAAIKVPLQDDSAFAKLPLKEATGALAYIAPPAKNAAKPTGAWNQLHLTVNDRKLKLVVNGATIQDVDLDELRNDTPNYQGLLRDAGHIGLQTWVGVVKFRNVVLKPLSEAPPQGKVTLTLDPGGHTARIGKVFFTRDGKHLVTGSADHSVRVWDVVTGEQRRVLRPPGIGDLSIMALSPTEDKVAVACQYPEGKRLHHVIYLLRLEDGQVERVLKGHKDLIIALAYSPDGKRLASSAEDASIRIWDPTTGKVERVLETNIGWRGIEGMRFKGVGELALSPAGDHLVYIATPREALVVEVATGKVRAKLPLPEDGLDVNGVAWSPDGKTIATSGRARRAPGMGIHLWSPDGKQLPQLDSPQESAAVTFSKDGRQALVAWGVLPKPKTTWGPPGPYHRASLLDLETGKPVATFAPTKSLVKDYGPPGAVAECALSPDGELAATVGGWEGLHEAFIWKTADGEMVHRLAARSWLRPTYQAAWSTDGKSVAWGFPKAKTRTLLDLGQLQLGAAASPGELRGPSLKEGPLTIEQREANKLYFQRQVVKNGEVIARLNVPHRSHNALFATFVGPERVAMAGTGGGFFFYDVASQKRIREFRTADGAIARASAITSIAASPAKARYLATLGVDQMLRIWHPERERPLLTLYVSGEDWIIWTEEGYYAATPGGERLIGWTVDNGTDQLPSFYPAERFRKQLYRPEVIKLVLEKGSVAEALKAAAAARPEKETRSVKVDDILPPRVTLTIADRSKLPIVKLKVRAEASVKDQPITSLALIMDRSVVPGSQTLTEFADGTPKAEVEWTFELPEGEHQLAVLARCPDASAVSQPVRLKHVELQKLPVLHVLTVGINNYKDSSLDLKYAVADARALATAFARHCKGEPFRDVIIRPPLLNEQATNVQIEKELTALRKQVNQQDLVVVFFACHGVKPKKEYYLLTHATDMNDLANTALSGEALRKSLSGFKCQVLLMLDACHSTSFGEGTGTLSKLGLKSVTDDAVRDLTDEQYGIAVLCAAMAHEKAEGTGGHGLFTRAVLDVLEKKPGVSYSHRDQRVYVTHLYSYVLDEVRARSKERQHPFLLLPPIVESFVVR